MPDAGRDEENIGTALKLGAGRHGGEQDTQRQDYK